MTETAVLPQPVDTAGDRDENHIACDTLDLTWCGQDSTAMIQADPDNLPPVETFCRVCVLGIEMWNDGDPCPVCGGQACLG